MAIWRIKFTDRSRNPRAIYREFQHEPTRVQIAKAIAASRSAAIRNVVASSAEDSFFEQFIATQGCTVTGVEKIVHLEFAKH
jgi:hypothetical protein